MDPTDLGAAVARAVDGLGGPRRLLVALFAGVAVLTGLHAVRPAPPPTLAVWAAARDLAGGRPLTAADVALRALPVADVPAGALGRDVRLVGRLLAAPVRRGEPLTDVRLLGPALLDALGPGLVAVPVRVADGSAAAALVGPGDLVDVLAAADPADGGPEAPSTVAAGVRVLAVPARTDPSGDSAGLVVVAATRTQAAALADASVTTRLSLALRRP